MYATVITTRYLSPEDLETAVEKLQEGGPRPEKTPGFEALYFVRTGATQTTHTVVFDSQENADAARKTLFPQFMELVGEHVDGEPTAVPGEVLIHR